MKSLRLHTSRGPAHLGTPHLQGPHTSKGLTPPRTLHFHGTRTSKGPTPPRASHLQGPHTSKGPTPPRALHLQGPRISIGHSASKGPTPPRPQHLQGPPTSKGSHLQGLRTTPDSAPPRAPHLMGTPMADPAKAVNTWRWQGQPKHRFDPCRRTDIFLNRPVVKLKTEDGPRAPPSLEGEGGVGENEA